MNDSAALTSCLPTNPSPNIGQHLQSRCPASSLSSPWGKAKAASPSRKCCHLGPAPRGHWRSGPPDDKSRTGSQEFTFWAFTVNPTRNSTWPAKGAEMALIADPGPPSCHRHLLSAILQTFSGTYCDWATSFYLRCLGWYVTQHVSFDAPHVNLSPYK